GTLHRPARSARHPAHPARGEPPHAHRRRPRPPACPPPLPEVPLRHYGPDPMPRMRRPRSPKPALTLHAALLSPLYSLLSILYVPPTPILTPWAPATSTAASSTLPRPASPRWMPGCS